MVELTLGKVIGIFVEGLLYIVVGLGAYLGRNFMVRIDRLESEVGTLKLKVAEEYVKKSDFETFADRIYAKLDHIDAKLDVKADKG